MFDILSRYYNEINVEFAILLAKTYGFVVFIVYMIVFMPDGFIHREAIGLVLSICAIFPVLIAAVIYETKEEVRDTKNTILSEIRAADLGVGFDGGMVKTRNAAVELRANQLSSYFLKDLKERIMTRSILLMIVMWVLHMTIYVMFFKSLSENATKQHFVSLCSQSEDEGLKGLVRDDDLGHVCEMSYDAYRWTLSSDAVDQYQNRD
jgi:hypothetical protein